METTTTPTQQKVRNSFDTNYEMVNGILRPTWDVGDATIAAAELGDLVRLDGTDFKAYTATAKGHVKFYAQLLEQFRMLPADVRGKLALEVRGNGARTISIGKYRGAEPEFARHSIELTLQPIYGRQFKTEIQLVEYEGRRRKAFGMPMMHEIAHATDRQVDTARMFAYMHLGLGDQYRTRA